MDTALSSEDLRRVDSLFKDLYIDSEIIRLKHLPDPTEFYREFVTLNRPCVIEVSVIQLTFNINFSKQESPKYLYLIYIQRLCTTYSSMMYEYKCPFAVRESGRL